MIKISGFERKKIKGGTEVIVEHLEKYVLSLHESNKPINICLWPPLCIFKIISNLLWNKERVICYEHFDPGYMKIKWRFLRFVFYRFAYKVVCISEYQRNYFSKFLPSNKIELIYNPIEINTIASNKENRILFVGHLRELKQVDVLLSAISSIQSDLRRDNWKLDILGSGDYKEKLVELSISLNIDDMVNFHGYIEDNKEFYRKSKILVLPSRTEGFPLVLLEAMSNECIVISNEYSVSVYEIIENNISGFVYKNNDDLHSILNLLCSILKQDDNALDFVKKNALDSLQEKSLNTFVKKWSTLINE